jgi:hypothetical protein
MLLLRLQLNWLFDHYKCLVKLTLTIGLGLTVTVETAVPVQPFVVPVTVYVVVVVNTDVIGLEIAVNPPVQL